MSNKVLQELNEVLSELESRKGFEREASVLHDIFMKVSQFEDNGYAGKCPECMSDMFYSEHYGQHAPPECVECKYKGEPLEEEEAEKISNLEVGGKSIIIYADPEHEYYAATCYEIGATAEGVTKEDAVRSLIRGNPEAFGKIADSGGMPAENKTIPSVEGLKEREQFSSNKRFKRISQFNDPHAWIKDIWADAQETGTPIRILYRKKDEMEPSDYVVNVDDRCELENIYFTVVIQMKNGSREGYPRYSRFNYDRVEGFQKTYAGAKEYEEHVPKERSPKPPSL